jgi:hypothetical protein
VISTTKRSIHSYLDTLFAREISSFTRHYDAMHHVAPMEHDKGGLLEKIQCPVRTTVRVAESLPTPKFDERSAILLNGNFNHHFDVESLLAGIRPKLNRHSRVVAVVYNSYLRLAFEWGNRFGIRTGPLPSTFLTQDDLTNLAELAGYRVVRVRPLGYVPFSLFGIGSWINSWLSAIPVLRWFGVAQILVLRPVMASEGRPSLSIVIPARNEKGNIEDACRRLALQTFAPLEVIFIEGHSSDGTWEEIQRVVPLYKDKFKILSAKQTGKGKCDAVRLGFSIATGDLLTILDADLTMPPELLERFYNAYVRGSADFINGSRLVYPMEGEAMRFLNWLGNIFFAKSLSAVLDVRVGDSLCGTKLVSRRDYQRFISWRKEFGDFDPFGDFELIFPAAVLCLDIVDVPVRYRARTYGSTNIHRFRHGFILLKMTLTGLFRIRTS